MALAEGVFFMLKYVVPSVTTTGLSMLHQVERTLSLILTSVIFAVETRCAGQHMQECVLKLVLYMMYRT